MFDYTVRQNSTPTKMFRFVVSIVLRQAQYPSKQPIARTLSLSKDAVYTINIIEISYKRTYSTDKRLATIYYQENFHPLQNQAYPVAPSAYSWF